MHPPSGTVEGPGGRVHLQPKAIDVLLCLAAEPGEIVERETFMREVWPKRAVGSDALTHCISEIRRALHDHREDPQFVQTVPNRGYRLLVAPQQDRPAAPAKGAEPVVRPGPIGVIEQLRRRKVFRVAALYIVSAWVTLQVVNELCGPLDCAPWTGRVTITVLAIGFPLALIVAWFAEEEPGPRRWLDAALLVVSVSAVALFVWLIPRPPGPPPIAANSIAVMPFRDLSPSRDQDWFCKGIAEVIMHRLTQLRQLKVASHTDTFDFPADADIATIVDRLGVQHVLEGSVRRQGDQLRVTAQLIDGATRFHVWSQEYDRRIEDIFAIQDEIAQRVVSTLNLVIKAGLDVDAPANLAAYEAYLRGREQLRSQRTNDALEAAERFFAEALEADPDYAGAYAGLCETALTRYEVSRAKASFDRAASTCSKALDLEPSSGPVHIALGNLYRVSGEHREAHREFDRAIALDPYDVEAYDGKARTFAAQNKLRKAEQTLERTLEIQPQFWRGHLHMGNFLFNSGRFAEAIPYFERVSIQLEHDATAFNNLASAHYMSGDFDAAASAWRRSIEIEPTGTAWSNVGSMRFYARRFDEAVTAYRQAVELEPDNYEHYGNLGLALFQTGQEQLAREALLRAAAFAEIALDINPNDDYAVSSLAVYYAALGVPERSRELIALAQRLAPREMWVYYDAARARILLDEPDRALDALRRAVALGYPAVLIPADAAFDALSGRPELTDLLETPLDACSERARAGRSTWQTLRCWTAQLMSS